MCNFLVVISSNLFPILPCFRDIAGFLLRRATAPPFHPNFGVFPLDWIADVVAPRCKDPELIYFELVQPICRRYLIVTDGRLTIAVPHFALRASCGKCVLQMFYCKTFAKTLQNIVANILIF